MNTQSNQVSFSHDCLIDTTDAAKLLGVGEATLIKWRSTGENNVPFVKIGRCVKYRTTDLRAYVEKHTHA